MALCVNEPKIGLRVYEAYRPLRGGIIRGLGEFTRGNYFRLVDVVWTDGGSSTITTAVLRQFDPIIDDHEKKLVTHKNTLRKLEQMAVDNPSLRVIV